MFTLRIKTDNAAFEDNGETEVSNLLQRVAGRVFAGARSGAIMDSNGNKVGTWSWKP